MDAKVAGKDTLKYDVCFIIYTTKHIIFRSLLHKHCIHRGAFNNLQQGLFEVVDNVVDMFNSYRYPELVW
jgi:hypothetical protein